MVNGRVSHKPQTDPIDPITTRMAQPQGSAWPFYLVVLTNLWCHLLFPLRFFSEAGVTALASHG